MKNKTQNSSWTCVGHMYRRDGSRSVAEFPMVWDGKMPDVPGVVRINKEYFVCTNTNPLTYHQANFAKAEVARAKRDV